jgi:hypothetical protein
MIAAAIAATNKRILAAIFIDEKFRIVRKIVIMKGVYSI